MTRIMQPWWDDTDRVKPKCLGLKKVFFADRPMSNRLSKAHINEYIFPEVSSYLMENTVHLHYV